jgi:hypothetical protein
MRWEIAAATRVPVPERAGTGRFPEMRVSLGSPTDHLGRRLIAQGGESA